MACCLESALLLLLLQLLGSASSTGGNRCVAAAEACTADAQCQQLRSEYVARCLGRAAPEDRSGPGGCVRSRCRRALRRFFARGPPALTHALLFCPCESPACAERRRQTFAPACAFAGPGPAPPSCLQARDRCERSRLCRPRLLAFQALCAPAPGSRDSCPEERGPRCRLAYAGLIGTAVTPNYLDNVSARVAPWCGCRDSGNRLEECEAFRKLFTRNPCLGLDEPLPEYWALFPTGVLGVRTHCFGSPGPALIRKVARGQHSPLLTEMKLPGPQVSYTCVPVPWIGGPAEKPLVPLSVGVLAVFFPILEMVTSPGPEGL